MLTTCLFWVLLALLLLNGVALIRPASPLARCSGSLLMLAGVAG